MTYLEAAIVAGGGVVALLLAVIILVSAVRVIQHREDPRALLLYVPASVVCAGLSVAILLGAGS